MFAFFRRMRNLFRFLGLSADRRRLVFYSEGKNYWPHLEGVLLEVLNSSDIPVCYVSSGRDDPGLGLKHRNLQSFEIDEGAIRNWLFENIDCEVMVMTMPDINQYQVKRSRHDVHYVYVQHSLVSLHMIYRKGAFDHYDTIFCAGPHHVAEVRAMEQRYGLPAKKVLEHGYGRLDAILEEARARSARVRAGNERRVVLVAPSWGPNGIIESMGPEVVGALLDRDTEVILRPHPQTRRLSPASVDAVVAAHGKNPLFSLDTDVAGQESLHRSDVMVSDWSGAALEYAFGLGKPVIFIDVPRKVNNPDYEEIGIEPFEVTVREKIGVIVSKPAELLTLDLESLPTPAAAENVFNLSCSAAAGARYICELLEKRARPSSAGVDAT